MRWSDYALLTAFCVVLCSFPLVANRTLTTHETVHCQNAREMRADGDWIIPHYGGRVWMERPPLPFWISNGVVALCGDRPFAYRLAALLMGIPVVLTAGWIACTWYGRGIGLTAGLVLATMQEFTHYATGPEADIFLCTIVTAAIALFVHLEFRCRPSHEESTAFVGTRPWAVLAFFLVLGLTNVVKGLFFGTIFVVLPAGCFLLSNRDWPALRRYLWLPGWLAFAMVGAAWPIAAMLQFPDVIDFWRHDYLGRVNQGYMREPFWYYFANLPAVLFPWTVPALFGLWLTRQSAFRERAAPERFLWCWAVVPILFFSIPQGKHHHYLLQCVAPWAILGALGAVRLWERIAVGPAWMQRAWLSLLVLALPGNVAILAFGAKIPGPPGLVPALLVAWPVCAYALWWALIQKNGRVALGTCCVLCVALYWAAYGYRTQWLDRYSDDSAFVRQVCATVPADRPVLVLDDDAPLNASWLLFYIGERATLLHNVTFLLDEKYAAPEVYLVARRKVVSTLARLGDSEVLLESRQSRYEQTPADRYALYRIRLHDDLQRKKDVRISPLQATGRAPGPYLYEIQATETPWPTP